MSELISINLVPDCLKDSYKNIAKSEENDSIIDTQNEKLAFRVLVNHAIKEQKISIDIAEEMGFERSELFIEKPEKEKSLLEKLGDVALLIFRMVLFFPI